MNLDPSLPLMRYLPNLVFIAIILVGTLFIEFFIKRAYKEYRKKYGPSRHMERTELMLRIVVLVLGIILILANIPGITQNAIRLTAAAIGIILAISSTTLIANGMSGILIKFSSFYNVGDMVKIGGCFGKVSEVGIFHTEVQTPMRELVTIPNSVAFKEPFVNYTEEKYIINVPVTISYNVDRKLVSDLLIKALNDTELEDPFVLVKELGPYWVRYTANGLLKDTGTIVLTESRLRRNILDRFNNAGVEIMSPDFYTIKQIKADKKVIPEKYRGGLAEKGEEEKEKRAAKKTEKIMFEKARKKEKIAKKKELSKEEIVEMLRTSKTFSKRDILSWAYDKGVKIPIWKPYEDIVDLLIKDEKISLTDIKNLFESAKKEEKEGEE